MNQRPTDHSVLTALSELRSLEDERLDEERAAAEQRKKDEAAAIARRREAELHAQRVAEAEARMRVEDESRSRDADADRRLAALRAELNAVQAERERLHGSLLASAGEPIVSRESSARPWAWAFAASAAVVAGLAVVLAFSGTTPPPVYVLAPAPAIAAPVAPVTQPEAVAPAVVAAPPVADSAVRTRPPRAGLTKVRRDRDGRVQPHRDGLDPDECDEDDPTCGM